MTKAFLFWLIMLLWLFFWLAGGYPWHSWTWGIWGMGVVQFVLFGLLGWQAFGKPVT